MSSLSDLINLFIDTVRPSNLIQPRKVCVTLSARKMTSQLSANYQALLNQLMLMDHETGKANSPPKLISLERYFNWKGRFES